MKLLHSMKHKVALSACALIMTVTAQAATYNIDSEGQHAFIQFKVSHLGYSYILGTIPKFTGTFEYDPENQDASEITVDIDVSSLNSHHAERDKHLKGDEFLDVAEYPTAKFVSTSYTGQGDQGVLKGDLTLKGVTKPIEIAVTKLGIGGDPWGGERVGFEGTTTINRSDFNVDKFLGPQSEEVELYLIVEGIKQ